MSPETFYRLARNVPANSVGWFDLLDRVGAFERWLHSVNNEEVHYAIWLMAQDAIIMNRAARVVELTRSALQAVGNDAQAVDRKRILLRLFNFSEAHSNRELFGLFLQLLSAGEFDEQNALHWSRFHALPKIDPASAIDLLSVSLDHYVGTRSFGDTKEIDSAFARIALPEGFVTKTARAVPEAFVRSMLPKVILLIRNNEVEHEDGEVSNRIWPWITLGFIHDVKASLLHALGDAMASVAKSLPDKLDEYTKEFENLRDPIVASLLLSAWSANARYYADRIVSFLLANPRRLNLSYGMWSTGNGTAAIGRGAVSAASAECSVDNLSRLETAIMDVFPEVEREDPRRRGYTQLLLLHAFDAKRISETARKRTSELDRKFPGIDLSQPGASMGAFVVESPIPATATQKMTDEQWISAMRQYSSTERGARSLRAGGASELAVQLETDVRKGKERFARLMIKLQPDIPALYFDAILRGLVATRDQSEGIVDKNQPTLPPLSSELLLPALRYAHELPNHPCGRWLCSAVGDIARRELPDDILEIVAFYALNGVEPTKAGAMETAYFGGDLATYGINTTRGAAADAIADLLFADPKRWPKLEAAVRAIALDRSWAVRSVSMSSLTALLNVNRDLAVELFLAMARETPAVLNSLFVERFLYYAAFSHYESLRPVLLGMLSGKDANGRTAAAQVITVASLRDPDSETYFLKSQFRRYITFVARVSRIRFGRSFNLPALRLQIERAQDLDRALAGDEISRAAVATIAAGNLQFPNLAERCRQLLFRCFKDDSAKVRSAASRCFHEISEEQLSHESVLIDAFLDSPAFRENASSLMIAIENSVHRLPDVVCKIPEKAVAIHRQESSGDAMEAQWWTHQMATLVLRLYEQTNDPKIRSRCLDVIDSMIELSFGNVAQELAKLERA